MPSRYRGTYVLQFCLIDVNYNDPKKETKRTLGCHENAKSLKSQAPQGFSGCLDIENDEMNKKKFLSASLRVN